MSEHSIGFGSTLIETLQEEIEQLKRDHVGAHRVSMDTVRHLETEIARLQELLRGVGANRYWEGRWREETAEVERLQHDNDQLRKAANAEAGEVERLRAVLRPFAYAAEAADDPRDRDASNIWERPVGMEITFGDLRRAHKAFGRDMQSPPDRFEQAVRRMNELTDGMEVDPDDEIADEPHEGGPKP